MTPVTWKADKTFPNGEGILVTGQCQWSLIMYSLKWNFTLLNKRDHMMDIVGATPKLSAEYKINEPMQHPVWKIDHVMTIKSVTIDKSHFEVGCSS